jgi:hypothetical protein
MNGSWQPKLASYRSMISKISYGVPVEVTEDIRLTAHFAITIRESSSVIKYKQSRNYFTKVRKIF